MDLFGAATYFDNSPTYDGYTGTFLWSCQFSSFNDSNAVGSTSTRRILSIGPNLSIPARKVVQIGDDRWIVGDGNPDIWDGQIIRQSFNMKKADALYSILQPGEACLASPGVQAYGQKLYFNERPDQLNTSDTTLSWNVFFGSSETALRGYIFKAGSEYYRAEEAYIPIDGWLTSKVLRLPSGPQAATFSSPTFDPITDTFAGSGVTAQVLAVPATQVYRNDDSTSPAPTKGDMTLLVAKSAMPTVTIGSQVTVAGETYRILASKSEHDAWMVTARDA